MSIILREVYRLIDQGDYRSAERACDKVLLPGGIDDKEEESRFRKLRDLASNLRLSVKQKEREEHWFNESSIFWRGICETNPSDKEASEAYGFAKSRSHQLMAARHTKALRADLQAGLETPS